MVLYITLITVAVGITVLCTAVISTTQSKEIINLSDDHTRFYSCCGCGYKTVPADRIPSNITLLKLSDNELLKFSSESKPNLDHLIWLYLNGNKLKSITLKNSHVLVVFLERNDISNISNSFKNLPNMQALALQENKITEIPKDLLNEMPVLELLNMSSNKIKHIPQQSCFTPAFRKHQLASLSHLFLDHNDISEIPHNTFDFRGLIGLYLQRNKIESVSDYAMKLPSLAILNLSGNMIESIDLASFPFVSEGISLTVDLSDNKIINLTNKRNTTGRVHTLDLSNNSVTPNSTVLFFDGLASLKVLILSKNKMIDVPRDVFKKQVELVSLDLSSNLFTKIPLFNMSSLRSLTSLNLSGNQIQVIDNDSLASLKGVKRLLLTDNNISHINANGFNHLVNLEYLDLRGNSFVCNCDIYGFSKWLSQHGKIEVKGAVCNNPEKLRGIDISSLNRTDFCLREDIFTFGVAVAVALVLGALVYWNSESLKMKVKNIAAAVFQGPKNLQQIRQIEISDQTLGYGSYGTVVYKGKLIQDGREVAVKKVYTSEISAQEVTTLAELSKGKYSQNVVKYYLCEKDSCFTYIALELCEGTLKDFFLGEGGFHDCDIAYKEILKNIADGLAFLHDHEIIHRDIKPENVLVSFPNPKADGKRHFLLADLGLARQLSRSYFWTVQPCGTVGWLAPELMNPNVKKTYKLDIFAAGCMFYYVLTKGMHPFGDVNEPVKCQENIHNQSFSVPFESMVDNMAYSLDESDVIVTKDLIASMICRDDTERNNASQVVTHPLMWNAQETLNFFHLVGNFIKSNELKKQKNKNFQKFQERLEENAATVIGGGGDWLLRMDKALRGDVGWLKKHRKEVTGIVQTIRNKGEHYHEFGDKLKEIYGEYPEGFLKYFTSRFPLIVLETYKAYKSRMPQCNKEVPH